MPSKNGPLQNNDPSVGTSSRIHSLKRSRLHCIIAFCAISIIVAITIWISYHYSYYSEGWMIFSGILILLCVFFIVRIWDLSITIARESKCIENNQDSDGKWGKNQPLKHPLFIGMLLSNGIGFILYSVARWEDFAKDDLTTISLCYGVTSILMSMREWRQYSHQKDMEYKWFEFGEELVARTIEGILRTNDISYSRASQIGSLRRGDIKYAEIFRLDSGKGSIGVVILRSFGTRVEIGPMGKDENVILEKLKQKMDDAFQILKDNPLSLYPQ